MVYGHRNVKVHISNTWFATLYYGERNLCVAKGLSAYTYELKDNELRVSKVYDEGSVIPAGTAVVLYGAEGDYELEAVTQRGERPSKNILSGYNKDAMTVGTGLHYALNYKIEEAQMKVGFFFKKSEGQPFMSKAHKAYLLLPQYVKRAALYLQPVITGIETVKEERRNSEKFDL